MSNGIRDQAVMIGSKRTLVGIVTQAAGYEPGDRPVFVILNSGIIHRVGHHRMYVTLARKLGGAGYQVLRFDLSGIGDSESQAHGLSLLDGVLADVREAIDWMATARQARRIILVGLCSGANYSLVHGISDPRVCGLVLLDPSIPPTLRFYLRSFLHHLVRAQSWSNFAAGRGRFWTKVRKLLGVARDDVRESQRLNLNEPEIRLYLQNAYQRSMDLGMQCLAVFTSGAPHQHNYRRQILDAFPTVPFADRLRLEYFAGCDHVFTSEADRNRLFRIVMDWVGEASFAKPVCPRANSKMLTEDAPLVHVSYEV
jgi:pimeloyl-ACP methyl ester carboxylesterase